VATSKLAPPEVPDQASPELRQYLDEQLHEIAAIANDSIQPEDVSSLEIEETQITDGALLARVADNETISGAWTFTGSNVYNGIAAANLLDKTAAETISGSWLFDADLQVRAGNKIRALNPANSRSIDVFLDASDAIITHNESTGDVYINNGTTGSYGPAALGILDPKAIVDDATDTWTLHRTLGIMMMTNNFGISSMALLAYNGTSIVVIWSGSNVSVGTSGVNPDVDTDVNIWISPSGTLNIKNRLGSTRTFDVYTFVG